MIDLSFLDISIIIGFFSITLFIGFYVSKKSSSSSSEYFLSGRNMPWWLLGISMVATTFSTDYFLGGSGALTSLHSLSS